MGFTVLFVFTVSLFAWLFHEIATSDKRARQKGYGPPTQLRGDPCATGKLACFSYRAPTLGRSVSFDYDLTVTSKNGDVTGTFVYDKSASEFSKSLLDIESSATYSGSLYLSFYRGHVRGRSLLGGLQVCEGAVGPDGARLTRGQRKGGILGFLRGPYEYSARRGTISFDKTSQAGCISSDSTLQIEDGRISGRVFHGPQKTWAIDVDVSFTGIKDEAIALVVILACDHILRAAHD